MSLRPYSLVLIGVALLGPFTHLWAWGAVGHQTVAYIAEDHLNPLSKAAVKEILGPNEDLASVSTWADSIVQTRKETAPWHYIDLNVRQDQNEFDEPDFCSHHDCVVDQIGLDLEVLTQPFASRREKQVALEFLVHFVGDLHQPLHCADDKDRGGNEKWFRFYPRGESGRFVWMNLHSLWDDLIEEKTKEDPRVLATQLERDINTRDSKEWMKG
ncbi:MAG TPA: S1/P1 nuclease, partial [bacterium]